MQKSKKMNWGAIACIAATIAFWSAVAFGVKNG